MVPTILSGVAVADDEAAIPIRELPPFPDVEASAQVSEVGVYGASQSEEETVVGAAKREQSLGTVASAVTVLTADQMRRFGYRSLSEALRGIAGVYIVDDRMVERIGVRGLQLLGDANTRVLILIDGTPLNEPWAQFVDSSTALPVSLDDVARIEVIRGPVSSIYGTNAFFGIINIVTRGATETPRAWARTGVNTINGVTTSAGFAVGGVDRQVRGSVSYNNRFGETLTLDEDPAFELSQDDSRAIAAGVVGAWDGWFGQVRAVRFNRESPFGPYDVNVAGSPYNQIDKQLIVEGGHTREVGKKLTVAARVYSNLY